MPSFYRIEKGRPITGSGTIVPPGYVEYDPQNPPAAMVTALAPTLEEARTSKLAEINAGYSAVMAYIQAGYPPEEVLSWERQAAQARELTQNPAAEAAFVRGLADAKSLPVEEMCARILANAASWEPVAAMLTGQRQVMEEVAYLAETVEGVQSIKVSYRV